MRNHQANNFSRAVLLASRTFASAARLGFAFETKNDACREVKGAQCRISVGVAIVMLIFLYRPLLAQVDVAQSQQANNDPVVIQQQILLLGDPNPAIRVAARAKLLELGAAAIGELEKAAKFETTLDYETQIAAVKILESIRAAVAVEETDRFLLGKTPLTGWPAFKKLTGDSPQSRTLFRDIYLRNRTELTQAMRSGTDGKFAGYDKLKQLFESPDLEQVCWGMFLLARQQTRQQAADGSTELPFLFEKLSKRELVSLLDTLARPTSPLSKLRTEIVPVTLLVRAIIETTPPDYPMLNTKFNLIAQIDSPEIGPLLIQFAAPANPTVVRAMAIAQVIKIGDANTFDQLQVYLTDSTVIGKYLTGSIKPAVSNPGVEQPDPSIAEVQVRDLVLLGSLRLVNQAHVDFGFDAEAINDFSNRVNIKRAGFVDNEDRETAFERFHSLTEK